MGILSFLLSPKLSSEVDILNTGLKLLIRFKSSSLSSLKSKLLGKYSFLSEDDLTNYEQQCNSAFYFGHDLVYMTMVKRIKAHDLMTGDELMKMYKAGMTKEYPWVNKSNLQSIYSTALYGLWHDGWHQFRKA